MDLAASLTMCRKRCMTSLLTHYTVRSSDGRSFTTECSEIQEVQNRGVYIVQLGTAWHMTSSGKTEEENSSADAGSRRPHSSNPPQQALSIVTVLVILSGFPSLLPQFSSPKICHRS
jgi:hypothetical protein